MMNNTEMTPPPDFTAVADSSPFVRTVWGADYEWPYIERTIERFTEEYKLDRATLVREEDERCSKGDTSCGGAICWRLGCRVAAVLG